jgi:hypothetical protein
VALSVTIGHPSGDCVIIEVAARMHPNADDFWEGNWLVSPIAIRVGGFRGNIDAYLRVEELVRFRDQLSSLHASLKGGAVLESLEERITLLVAVAPSGQLTVTGRVSDDPGIGNELAFEIDGLDQTYLPPMIESLSAIETAFPLLGSPPLA